MRLMWIAAVPALACGLLGGLAQAASIPDTGELRFQVLREGEPVGSHVMRFADRGDALQVDIKTDIAVKMAFITVYRFAHDGHETWRNGQLVSLTSKTDEDGTPHHLQAKGDGSRLAIAGDGFTGDDRTDLIPASLWNARLVTQDTLLNTLDGRAMAVAVNLVGDETVPARGRSVAARHYVIDGDLKRDVWYDAEGVLVRVHFKGKDGSDIIYHLL